MIIIVIFVQVPYHGLNMGLHGRVDAHLPVDVFSNLGHNQLGAFICCIRCVVENCIVTLGLLVGTHGKGIDIEHSFRC